MPFQTPPVYSPQVLTSCFNDPSQPCQPPDAIGKQRNETSPTDRPPARRIIDISTVVPVTDDGKDMEIEHLIDIPAL
jgi:hypothetical protein